VSLSRPTPEEYRTHRAKLIEEMGGVCSDCGAKEKLEFGHKSGRTWTARKLNRMQRLRMYRKDWLLGILQLECHGCNFRKYLAEKAAQKQVEELTT
jgi:hypothetical protein